MDRAEPTAEPRSRCSAAKPTCELRYALGVLQQKWHVVVIQELPTDGDTIIIEREEWRPVPDASDG